MTAPLLLLLPLLLPCAAPALARRAGDRLAPGAALWVLTTAAVVLAGCSAAALGGFVLTGLLKLPLFAALGDLVHPLRIAPDAVVVPAAVAGAGALAVCAGALVRTGRAEVRALRAARARAARVPAAGDLCVLDSPYPDAYALPGRPHRIVVTTAMLRSLDAAEREVLFAHERAHNRGGHHWFLAAAELAAHCHPALRPVREAVRLAAERAADEAAAAAVGDRRLAARAVARAALAGQRSRSARPRSAPAVGSGPVPRRVTALLAAPHVPGRAATRTAALLLACAALSFGASATGVLDVHHRVEVAQGEASR
ncbi:MULTISPECIES: M48 family metalloprotease [unclassified Streptomyces]|uniref:M48 family metalloprotease n=1 Tax=unclassified Streptomyces TaxID=2593676 RepID=UPI0007DDA0BF|nr:M48 family metalloprotease [Streptomyces sp. SAT1]ANH90171.1 peptidase M48 Ste24p [Streptomyces sp. SAT1]